jgi:hypothetical protein
MDNEFLRSRFLAFMIQNHEEENLYFYEQALDYKKAYSFLCSEKYSLKTLQEAAKAVQYA